MDLFLILIGLSVFYLIVLRDEPLIVIKRSNEPKKQTGYTGYGYSADKPASHIGAIPSTYRGRYASTNRGGYASGTGEMKPPPASATRTKPQGNHGTAPVSDAKPTESNVKAPEGGSGQSPSLKKE